MPSIEQYTFANRKRTENCDILCPLFLTSTAFVVTKVILNYKCYADLVSVILSQSDSDIAHFVRSGIIFAILTRAANITRR